MSSEPEQQHEVIGKNIEVLQDMVHTPLDPPPRWIQKWQMMAEHVVTVAIVTKEKGDLDQLRMLDEEAAKLVEERKAKLSR